MDHAGMLYEFIVKWDHREPKTKMLVANNTFQIKLKFDHTTYKACIYAS